jgi:hypothetical protein
VDVKDKTIEEQKEKITKLEDIIGEKEKQIKNLKGNTNLQKNNLPRPSEFPHCGFEKIYKNGTYEIRPERFLEQLRKDEEIEITVQQFIYPYCRSSVYTPGKKKKIIIF